MVTAPKGQLCYGIHNWQLKKTTNAFAAWSNEKILAPLLFEQNISADVFYAWMTEGLIPELQKNSVLVMDNASFHKRKDIVESIKKVEHDIHWLPPYSPDFNPIEEVWGCVKAARKRWQMDDFGKLFFYFI